MLAAAHLSKLRLLAVLVSCFIWTQTAWADDDGFDLLGEDFSEAAIVEVPPEPSLWLSHAAPIGLILFFFFIIWLNKVMVPFRESRRSINLHEFPTGIKRGLAFAFGLYGIAFTFGALEIHAQLSYYSSAEEYFEQMSYAKLVAFTHGHLFGFTTSFLIIGVPFSMQFNHLRYYQIIFPMGLASALIDVMSWWGIKYLHGNFEYVSIFCGIVFSLSYMYMLVAMIRVLIFPGWVLKSDKDWRERVIRRDKDEFLR